MCVLVASTNSHGEMSCTWVPDEMEQRKHISTSRPSPAAALMGTGAGLVLRAVGQPLSAAGRAPVPLPPGAGTEVFSSGKQMAGRRIEGHWHTQGATRALEAQAA